MTHKFTVGEYKTKSGANAVVLEVGPDDFLFGRRQDGVGGLWYASEWGPNGTCQTFSNYRLDDLVPLVQMIWMVSWINNSGVIDQSWSFTKDAAEHMATYKDRTKIAITGPHEVPQ